MDSRALHVRINLWTWSISIWFAFAVMDAAKTVIMMRVQGTLHAWFGLFWLTVLFWLPWALTTVPVIWLGRRFPPVRVSPVLNWFVHLAAYSTINLVFAVWTAWLARFVALYRGGPSLETFSKLLLERFLNATVSSVVFYTGILVVSHVLDSKARLAEQQTHAARLNEQLSMARLDALRKQIEPHFLFNTLNAVSGLVRGGRGEDAVTMIAGLSDFLRHTLQRSTRQQVPLAEELEFVQRYLSIEKIRFGDRMQLRLDVPLDLYQAQVPNLILQPIVENAVKHGIAKRAQGGTIRVSASLDDGKLTLTVANDGPPLLSIESSGFGIGNHNVQTRLRNLYGDDFEYKIENGRAGGVEVAISVPYIVSSTVGECR